MKNPPKTVIRMPGETDEGLIKRREEAMTPNQTGFKCIDCEKIFTDEEPTILNIDDWLGIYEDYGPVCKICKKEIREGDYESIASW